MVYRATIITMIDIKYNIGNMLPVFLTITIFFIHFIKARFP